MAQLVSASDCYISPSGGSQFNPVRGRFLFIFVAFLMKKMGGGLLILDGESEVDSAYGFYNLWSESASCGIGPPGM